MPPDRGHRRAATSPRSTSRSTTSTSPATRRPGRAARVSRRGDRMTATALEPRRALERAELAGRARHRARHARRGGRLPGTSRPAGDRRRSGAAHRHLGRSPSRMRRYELALYLDAELVPLTALAERVRDRIHAAARDRNGGAARLDRRRVRRRRGHRDRARAALARLVGFLLLVALAVAGLAAAVFCIGDRHERPSLGGLARLVHAAALRDSLGGWFDQLAGVGLGRRRGGAGRPRRDVARACAGGRRARAAARAPGRSHGAGAGTLAARRRPLAQVRPGARRAGPWRHRGQGPGAPTAPQRAAGACASGPRVRVRPSPARCAVGSSSSWASSPGRLRSRRAIQITDDGAKVQ